MDGYDGRPHKESVAPAAARRRILSVRVGYALLLFLLTACAPVPGAMGVAAAAATPAVIHVEADGSGDSATLEEALAAAEPGTIIALGAGRYQCAGTPIESGKAVTLSGAGADTTEIVCDAAGYVLRHYGEGTFSAEGITFRHEGAEGANAVFIEGTGSIAFRACRFTGAVEDGEHGVPGAGLHLGGNVSADVSASSASGNRTGILVTDRAWAALTGNSTSENAVAGIGYSRWAAGAARNNDCSHNGHAGITVADQAKPTLEGNSCLHNGRAGIAYSGSAGGAARENDCSYNDQGGIGVTEEANPALEDNVCANNVYVGIGYIDAAGGVARHNRCVGNAYMGIVVAGQADPTLEANSCRYNGSFGIFYHYGAPAGVARGNDCSGNGQGGIAVGGHARPQLEANECRNNLGAGIVYYEQAGGTAEGNQCTGNRRYGLAVTQEASPTIGANTFSGNAIEDVRTMHGD